MQKGYRTFTNHGLGIRGAVLYDTTVVKIDGKKMTLNNGGWVTMSTCKAINNYLNDQGINAKVSRKNGEMILNFKTKTIVFQNGTVEVEL
jgi:hypothetical protein